MARNGQGLAVWCGRRDLTPHDFRHWNLNPARLPVPPRPPRASNCQAPPGGAAYNIKLRPRTIEMGNRKLIASRDMASPRRLRGRACRPMAVPTGNDAGAVRLAA